MTPPTIDSFNLSAAINPSPALQYSIDAAPKKARDLGCL